MFRIVNVQKLFQKRILFGSHVFQDLFDDNFNFGVFHDLLAFLFERWVKKQEVTLLVLKSGLSYVGGIGLLFGDVQTGKMSGILTHDVATSAYFAGVSLC